MWLMKAAPSSGSGAFFTRVMLLMPVKEPSFSDAMSIGTPFAAWG